MTIVFDTPILSVTMDPAEFFVFAGGEDGNIYEIRLFEKALNTLHKEIEPLFVGHRLAQHLKLNLVIILVELF